MDVFKDFKPSDEELEMTTFKKEGMTPAIFEVTFFFSDGVVYDYELDWQMFAVDHSDLADEAHEAVSDIKTIDDIKELLDCAPPELSNAVRVVGTLKLSTEQDGDLENGYYDILVVNLEPTGFVYYEVEDMPVVNDDYTEMFSE